LSDFMTYTWKFCHDSSTRQVLVPLKAFNSNPSY